MLKRLSKHEYARIFQTILGGSVFFPTSPASKIRNIWGSLPQKTPPGLTQLIVQMLDDQIFAGAPEDVTDSAWQLLIEVLCEVRTGRAGRSEVFLHIDDTCLFRVL